MSTLFKPILPANIVWQDGVPVAPDYGDIYFSCENGLEEARHVFIDGNQLLERWQCLEVSSNQTFVVGELGFGSGLNFLLAWNLWLQNAPKDACLHFVSCEKHPLTKKDFTQAIMLWPQLQNEARQLIEVYPVLTPGFHHLVFSKGRVKLTLMLGDAAECFEQLLHSRDAGLQQKVMPKAVDAWFLDGFAPGKNPEMWQDNLLKTLGLLSCEKTTLATFSAAGWVKRGLENSGFQIKKIKGFGAKREMITARFVGPGVSLQKPTTPWAFVQRPACKNNSAVIVGGGLAGCYLARSLADRGWLIKILDQNTSPGEGGSGNTKAVLFPNISAYKAPLTDLMLSAFIYSSRRYQGIAEENSLGELNGILQFYDDLNPSQKVHLERWLHHYSDLGEMVSASKASDIAGVCVTDEALFIPYAGWLDSKKLCDFLIDHKNIQWEGGAKVEHIHYEKERWDLGSEQTQMLILACGYHTKCFPFTEHLPLRAIRGQMTFLKESSASKQLKIPVCGKGHVLPSYEEGHALGASYDLDNTSPVCLQEDDEKNLSKLSQLPVDVEWSTEIVDQWGGIRAITPDYLPLVGPVSNNGLFIKQFGPLAKNANRLIRATSPCYPGLYVLAGFGSRGITTIPLCAEWLAGYINQELPILSRQMIESISPSRFLKRTIIKNLFPL